MPVHSHLAASGPASVAEDLVARLFGERHVPAAFVAAEEPARLKTQAYPLPECRKVLQVPCVSAVDLFRFMATVRTDPGRILASGVQGGGSILGSIVPALDHQGGPGEEEVKVDSGTGRFEVSGKFSNFAS